MRGTKARAGQGQAGGEGEADGLPRMSSWGEAQGLAEKNVNLGTPGVSASGESDPLRQVVRAHAASAAPRKRTSRQVLEHRGEQTAAARARAREPGAHSLLLPAPRLHPAEAQGTSK